MSWIDYWGVRQAVKDVLEADANLFGVTVLVEKEFLLSPELAPLVVVYIEDRIAPPGEQRISAGTRTDFQVNFNLYVGDYHLGELDEAIKARDGWIGKVEVALMQNRTLSGSVGKLWLTGGQLFDARSPEVGFLAWGEVRFTASVAATTT